MTIWTGFPPNCRSRPVAPTSRWSRPTKASRSTSDHVQFLLAGDLRTSVRLISAPRLISAAEFTSRAEHPDERAARMTNNTLKWMLRHKITTAAGSVVAVLLVVGAVG